MTSSNSSRSKVPWLLIIFSSLTIFLPVIIFPHWGLFSDAGQIILTGRQFWADPWNRFDLIKGYWRPAFHLLDLITYKLFGEKPEYFYLVQYLIFSATAVLTYLNCLFLSGSRLLSTIFALFLLLSSSTLEVIYTLDKGEARIGLFISLVLYLYIRQDEKLSELNSKLAVKYKIISPAIVITLTICLFLALFTKETSQIILLNTVTLPSSSIIFLILTRTSKKRIKLRVLCKFLADPRTKWNLLYIVLILLSFISYKIFFYLTGGASADNYSKINLGSSESLKSVFIYKNLIPDTICLLIFCLGSSTIFIFNHIKRSRDVFIDFGFLHSLNLTLISLAYFLLLINFRWKLIYIWFPINVFLLPASCYYFTKLSRSFERLFSRAKVYSSTFLATLLLVILPIRFIEAQAIFSFDYLKDSLATSLLAYRAEKQVSTMNIVLPFQVAEAAEVGERLEFFILERFFRVSEGRSFKRGDPFRIFNFLDYTPANSNYPKPAPFASYPTKENTNSDPFLISSAVGIQLFAYELSKFQRSTKDALWTRGILVPGMYFIIPYGELPDILHFRGANFHKVPVEYQFLSIPQVRWQEEMQVERSIVDIFGKRRAMGWKLVKITDAPAISWNLFTDSWLPEETEIYIDKELSGSVMTVQGLPISDKLDELKFSCGNKGNFVTERMIYKLQEQVYEFTVDLSCAKSVIFDPEVYSIQIRSADEHPNKDHILQNKDHRNLLFHIKKVSFRSIASLTSPSHLSTFPFDLNNPNLEYSGLYKDGWVSKAAFLRLSQPSVSSQLTIRGLVPTITDPNFSLELCILVNGQEVANHMLKSGEFDIKVEVPRGEGRRRIDLLFSKFQLLPAPDNRPVTAQLKFIGFDDENPQKLP